MGSYDTSESYTPRRSFSGGSGGESSRGSSRPSVPLRTSAAPPTTSSEPALNQYDPDLPTIVALGGGLTPSRIVKKLPDEVKTGKLIDAVNYLIKDEVLATKEEIAVAEAVKERMQAPDYRAIINEFYNYHNERLQTDELSTYLQEKDRQTEAGSTKINFCDIAIVSHDEGGRSLEERV
ncbi:hypothetical protein HN587_00715 [Candidatus Woesearchaeota archaeon]|jgi:hypothetical protein|nr:hypothetical protein [Candidatus Woesearchaeota archaeon]